MPEVKYNSNTKIQELESLVDSLSSELASSFYQTLQVLERLTTFIEKYYEGSHSRFVSEKSTMIATELDMSEEAVMEIKIAALLHDIGKIGFSDNMLYKYSSEMTDSEYKAYTKHSQMGMEILKPYRAFDQIGKIIYQHHERCDGMGFPRNLKGQDIHPGAKIISVVDFFHNAVYKRLRTRSGSDTGTMPITSTSQQLDITRDRYNSAMNYLMRKSGSLYEKKVVTIFMDMMELDRSSLGSKSVMRVAVNKIEPGMILAENYNTSFGLLIAAKGEKVSKEIIKALLRFADAGELPNKILIIK